MNSPSFCYAEKEKMEESLNNTRNTLHTGIDIVIGQTGPVRTHFSDNMGADDICHPEIANQLVLT